MHVHVHETDPESRIDLCWSTDGSARLYFSCWTVTSIPGSFVLVLLCLQHFQDVVKSSKVCSSDTFLLQSDEGTNQNILLFQESSKSHELLKICIL